MASALECAREEDFVEYFLFPLIENNSSESELNSLHHVIDQISKIVNPLVEPYIWHKDEFKLNLRPSKFRSALPSLEGNTELPAHLYGITHYGDNIEDEWFIVFLLMRLTENMPGLVARVADVDGEFLLIESADYLPRWAVPEKCEGRVFIFQGEIHLVPPENDKTPASVDFHEQIRNHPEWTRASQSVQDCIRKRIHGYPEKMASLFHKAHAFLPVSVAALLEASPSLISSAVLAFCHRDPIDVKVCRIMKKFPPQPSVLRSVKFTKCLYAMISQQNYMPDKRAGWRLSPPTDPAFTSHMLGVKIACGFEILASQVKVTSASKEDLETDKGWHTYKQSLIKNGYFKELLEGSKEYSLLEHTAQDHYLEMENRSQPVTGKRILDLLGTLHIDEEKMRKEEKNLPPPDDDSWMNISPEELDSILAARFGFKDKVVNVTDDPQQITSKLMAFFNRQSDLDGVEEEEEPKKNEVECSSGVEAPKRPPRKNKASSQSAMNSAKSLKSDLETDMFQSQIQFDQEAFACELKNVLDLVVPEDDWDLESDSSGMSSYEDEMDLIEKSAIKPSMSVSELKQYMDQMDKELASTTIGQSFDKVAEKEHMEDDSFSDIENFKPVNVDMNALKNLMKSYEEQIGEPGPTSTLLGSMGVKLENSRTSKQ
ncbi:unnamed protein product [Bemisia tabaci]|uniref:Ecdysoneless n=1 Tax=Bemisia tabaci TaxID=7038 RepID=A0A9P0AG27_BEMTA|nr:unnamed protein product [Bemisia tabaci]